MDKTSKEKKIYDRVMTEFQADVRHKIMFAYEIIRDHGSLFPADLYFKARGDYSPAPEGLCDYCEEAKDFEKYCVCQLCSSEEDRMLSEWDLSEYEYRMADRRVRVAEEESQKKHRAHKQYKEMTKFDIIDAFLTERIKDAICEDVLGEIFTFL